jgi:hypothetical protein
MKDFRPSQEYRGLLIKNVVFLGVRPCTLLDGYQRSAGTVPPQLVLK